MINIGIIGIGNVGHAVSHGLQKVGNNVCVHDIKLNTKIEGVIDTELLYICVPTPSRKDGSCDVAIVEKVVEELHNHQYNGIIAIKSTVIVGTTQRLIEKYNNPNICFVPEFLRERCAIADFTENHDVLMIGTENQTVFDLVNKSHVNLPKQVVQLTPSEAELSKYFNNIYNANLIIFANTFYEICQHLGLNYHHVKEAVTKRSHINNKYLECSQNIRNFGGNCLPKDLRALNVFQRKELRANLNLLQCLLDENEKFGA